MTIIANAKKVRDMYKTIKMAAAVLALLTVLSLLTACGGMLDGKKFLRIPNRYVNSEKADESEIRSSGETEPSEDAGVSCGGEPETDSSEADSFEPDSSEADTYSFEPAICNSVRGTWDGNTYTNGYLNLTMSFPEEHIVVNYSDEQLARLSGITVEQLCSDDVFNYTNCVYDAFSNDYSNNVTSMILTTNICLPKNERTRDMLIEGFVGGILEGMQKVLPDAEMSERGPDVTIGSETYIFQEFSLIGQYGGFCLVRKNDPHLSCIMLLYPKGEITSTECINLFDSIH